MKKKIELTKDKRDYMISEIKDYYAQERNEQMGDLAATLILDFIIDKIAPEIYNQGIYDSYLYMNNSIEDLLGIQKY